VETTPSAPLVDPTVWVPSLLLATCVRPSRILLLGVVHVSFWPGAHQEMINNMKANVRTRSTRSRFTWAVEGETALHYHQASQALGFVSCSAI
jgi:hypothetical protein